MEYRNVHCNLTPWVNDGHVTFFHVRRGQMKSSLEDSNGFELNRLVNLIILYCFY